MFDDKVLKQVIDEAVAMDIPREMILPLRIFWIPFFDFNEYIEIKKSNVSIISDYCFAGYLYHKFGMKFTSPTINMFSDNDNYYRFISDIEGHMKLPMIEVENTVNETYRGMFAYPRGRVGDSEWEFNHDELFETAAARWKRGAERFNPSNFIVTMTIRSDEMAYKFHELPIEHKMGFYWKDLGLDSIICMPEWNSPKCRAKFGYDFAVLTNRAADETNGIRAINWMKALLHKEGYNRVQ